MRLFCARFPKLVLIFLVFSCFPGLPATVRPPDNASEILLRLEGLNVLGSVLMIAAHPDDENTALLAYLARGRKVETTYLSATRGEGGQNLIGSEQGDLLGVIRTQELLAARRLDGSRQMFTRAIDFGFTKTVEETLSKWGKDRILEDIVLAIRTLQPDIVILRFSGTPRDGHGQHQASAILGREAFFAAADKARFPEPGLGPWQAKRLLGNLPAFTRQMEQESESLPGRIVLDTGEYNPLLGRSYAELGSIGRSQHRSQAMGVPERHGPVREYFMVTAGEKASKDVFDGVDLTWNRVEGGAEAGRILAEAVRTFSAADPARTLPLLLKARPLLRGLKDRWATIKLRELDDTIAACAGLWLDAAADRYLYTPGSAGKVRLTAVNRSHFPLSWQNEELAYNSVRTREQELAVPAGSSDSQPFWLVRPKQDSSYTIESPAMRNLPEAPPRTERFEIHAGAETIVYERPVLYRYVDPAEGELTRPVVTAPPVAVNLSGPVFVFPNRQPQKVQVQLRASVKNVQGELRLKMNSGWQSSPPSLPFRLAESGEEASLTFQITPGAQRSTLRAVATVGGQEISTGMRVIAYSHIPPQTVFPAAEARLEPVDAKLLSRKIGYVPGAGDEVPQALRQMGCEVTMLSSDDLTRGELGAFDAIVTGVRAYNTRADLRAARQRLLDYVSSGGTLVVQYNVAERGFMGRRETGSLDNIGPYAFKVGVDRVTVENSPVTLPNPRHPLWTSPNQIDAHDFEGWIQERGLYFAGEWDPKYDTPLESHDPGEKPLPGGMLYARYGKGVYIYTSYAWFRQLPAGVPGAYRIFANLVSAGRVKAE